MDTSSQERRRSRSWPEALKREIVASSLRPGSSVSLVARRYDVNANQVFAWRRRYRSGSAEPAGVQLVPVTVTPDQQIETPPARANELIEIELAAGYRVRIGSGVKAASLRLVLELSSASLSVLRFLPPYKGTCLDRSASPGSANSSKSA